jgi:parvulin-like peptidyl-prolyl isomerase
LAKKKKAEKPKREFTKRQLSHWEQQKKRRRLFLILGISVIAVAAGITGRGFYITHYQPMHETVIRVNDTEFSMGYYIKMLEFSAGDQPDYLPYLAGQVVTAIEQNALIRQGAERLGVVATDSEVEEMLKQIDPSLSRNFGEDLVRDLTTTEILMAKVRDVYFDQWVPEFANQRHIMAMFLESEGQATEVRARLKNGDDFGELAGELSLESFSQTENGDLGWHPYGILSGMRGFSIVDDYAFTLSVGSLSQPLYDQDRTKSVGYWLVKVLDKDGEEAEAEAEAEEEAEAEAEAETEEEAEVEREAEAEFELQVMLLGSEQEAQEVITRLEGGEDFGEVAKELSQDDESKEDGGDLGWLASSEINPAYQDFVLNAEPGALSESIKDETVATTGGYWLVEVLEEEDDRQVEDSDRDFFKQEYLDEWVSSLWDDPGNEIESYLDEEKQAWAIDQAMQNITG